MRIDLKDIKLYNCSVTLVVKTENHLIWRSIIL
jgi:hypothetical protein